MFKELPRELQDEILSYCDRQDRRSLRLAHSCWYDATSDALFHDFSLVCFAWSLRKLRALSRSRLAERVKVLTVYSAVLGECKIYGPGRDPDYAEFKYQMQHLVFQGCRICNPYNRDCCIPRGQWPQAYAVFQAYKESHQEFLDKIKTLRRAVKRLSLRSLTVRHFADDNFHPTRHLDEVVWGGESFEMAEEITTSIREERRSPCIMPKLVLPSTLRKLNIHQEVHSQWRVALPALEELDLQLLYGQADPVETVQALVRCPTLKKLKLVYLPGRGGALEEHAHFDEVLALPLQELSLSIVVSTAALLSFRGRLELRNCWTDDVFAFLRSWEGDLDFYCLYQWETAYAPRQMPCMISMGAWKAGYGM